MCDIETIEKYETRVVAYADILGWSSASKNVLPCILMPIVGKIKSYALNFSEEIKQELQDSSGVPETLIQEHAGIEFSFFSDNFVLSAPVNYGQKIFEILAWVSHDLLRNGFLVRGGLTIGKIIHNKGIIFGPALVEAVNLEKKASYPCILCGGEELEKYLEQMDSKRKNVMLDRNQKLVVNIAIGSTYAKDDLMEVINKKLSDIEKVRAKWKYLKEILPRMYENQAVN